LKRRIVTVIADCFGPNVNALQLGGASTVNKLYRVLNEGNELQTPELSHSSEMVIQPNFISF
jgi:hypothetical protein